LKISWDVHGHTMWDAWKSGESFDIVERDDGFIISIPGSSYLAKFEDWPEIERRAMDSVRGRVIDLGFGAGRVALHLQQKGFDVLGFDVSPLALKVCRERGVRKTRRGSIHDLRFPRGSFDTAIMFGNNFSLLGTPVKATKTLRKLRRVLSDGGVILAETLDPYDTKEPSHLAYHRMNRKKGRLPGQVRMRVRYKQYSTPWFYWLLLSREEMRGLAGKAGFEVTGYVNPSGPRYIGLLRKV
jgi:SAM-dependent methyltransferase